MEGHIEVLGWVPCLNGGKRGRTEQQNCPPHGKELEEEGKTMVPQFPVRSLPKWPEDGSLFIHLRFHSPLLTIP